MPFQLQPASRRRAVFTSEPYRTFSDRLVAVADRLVEEFGAELVLVPMYRSPWETDEPLAERIARRAARPGSVRVFRPQCAIAELLDELRGLDAFVGTPMHGTILATSQGVPTFGLPYERKGAEYLERIGQSTCMLPVEALLRDDGVDAFSKGFRALWDRRDEVRAELAREIPRARAAAEENRDVVREAFGLARRA